MARITGVSPDKKEIERMVREYVDHQQDTLKVEGIDRTKWEPRWLNTNKHNLELKKQRGWKIVSSSDPEFKDVRSMSKTPDGTHEVGDLVLAVMPRDRYEAMQAAKVEIGRHRRREAASEFKEDARKYGIKIIEDKE